MAFKIDRPAGKRPSSGDAKQGGDAKRLKSAGGSARPASHAGKPAFKAGSKPAYQPQEHASGERLNR